MSERVTEFAKENGYKGAEKKISWNGYEVYEPIYGNRSACTGYPLVILVKGDEIRLSTDDEALEILDILYPGDNEE